MTKQVDSVWKSGTESHSKDQFLYSLDDIISSETQTYVVTHMVLAILKVIRPISITGKQGYFRGFCNHKSVLDKNLSMVSMNDLAWSNAF